MLRVCGDSVYARRLLDIDAAPSVSAGARYVVARDDEIQDNICADGHAMLREAPPRHADDDTPLMMLKGVAALISLMSCRHAYADAAAAAAALML